MIYSSNSTWDTFNLFNSQKHYNFFHYLLAVLWFLHFSHRDSCIRKLIHASARNSQRFSAEQFKFFFYFACTYGQVQARFGLMLSLWRKFLLDLSSTTARMCEFHPKIREWRELFHWDNLSFSFFVEYAPNMCEYGAKHFRIFNASLLQLIIK